MTLTFHPFFSLPSLRILSLSRPLCWYCLVILQHSGLRQSSADWDENVKLSSPILCFLDFFSHFHLLLSSFLRRLFLLLTKHLSLFPTTRSLACWPFPSWHLFTSLMTFLFDCLVDVFLVYKQVGKERRMKQQRKEKREEERGESRNVRKGGRRQEEAERSYRWRKNMKWGDY